MNSVKTMNFKIDDLCPEILFKIFSYLPLSDLFTMCDVSKLFRSLMINDNRVRHLFEESYRNTHKIGLSRKIDYSLVKIYIRNLGSDNSLEFFRRDDESVVEIEGISMALRFIRIFGRKFKHLDIDCFCSCENHCEGLFEYVKKYVRGITDLFVSNLVYDKLQVPRISKITRLFITSCYIPSSFGKFNRRFPQLQGLYFFGSNVFEKIENIIVNYRNLESMGYEGLCGDLCFALSNLNKKASIVAINNNALIFTSF